MGGGIVAGVGAAALRWSSETKDPDPSSAVQSSSTDASCARLGLPNPAAAQKMPCVALRDRVSSEDREALHDMVQHLSERHALGVVERGPSGERKVAGEWRTTYLHTNGAFQQHLGPLHDKLRAAAYEADEAAGWGLLKGRDPATVNFRTVELHEYGAGGRLSSERHYDAGSLVTVDVMLAAPGEDFEGGDLVTPEADGSLGRWGRGSISGEANTGEGSGEKARVAAATAAAADDDDGERATERDVGSGGGGRERTAAMVTVSGRGGGRFEQGDVVIFPSHKYHNVLPVVRGRRRVLVAELWEGEPRTCAHRCLKPKGECPYTLSRAQMATTAQHLAMLG